MGEIQNMDHSQAQNQIQTRLQGEPEGKPLVMISGFTLLLNEFRTPYRVINYHVCNGCWNDGAIGFVHDDLEWCPRHKPTDRQYECTRYITAEKVCRVIDQLMKDYGFGPKQGGR